jgi:hypothetical protein
MREALSRKRVPEWLSREQEEKSVCDIVLITEREDVGKLDDEVRVEVNVWGM